MRGDILDPLAVDIDDAIVAQRFPAPCLPSLISSPLFDYRTVVRIPNLA
jgi:hypothetical protein